MRAWILLLSLFSGLLLPANSLAANRLVVGIGVDHPTVEFATLEGEAKGVLVDIWRRWGQANGYQVGFLAAPYQTLSAALQEGRIDLIANARPGDAISYSSHYTHLDYYLFSEKNRYLETPEKLQLKIGVLNKDSALLQGVLQGRGQVKLYRNYPELLDDLQAGIVDFMLANDINLNFSVKDESRLLRLHYPKTPFYTYPVRAAALQQNLALIATFEQGLKRLTPVEIESIRSQWMPSTVGYRLPWSLIGIALVVLMASIMILIIWIMNLKLEQKVAEQTLALEGQTRKLEQDIERRKRLESELQLAKVLADSASEAKSNFLANMTHELRTPLIGVLGMNELLMTTELTEQQRALAITVQRSGDILLSLVSDILDFSKLESQTLTLRALPVDLSQIVEETALLLAGQAAEKGVQLVCQVSPNARWEVSSDPLRLRQILLNLISNAVKFTACGNVIVRLDMSPHDDSRGHFRLVVEDSGIGMNKEDQERIFAPFVQIDSAASRAFGGTGLGLAIVRQLVELMGGALSVESQVDQGSLFRVELDLQLLTAKPLQVSADCQGQRVLVQESHAVTRDTLQMMLGYLGLEVVAVETAEEAWQKLLEPTPFDLALVSSVARFANSSLLSEAIIGDPAFNGLSLILLCPHLSILKNNGLPGLPLLEVPVTWGQLLSLFDKACTAKRQSDQGQLELLAVPPQRRFAGEGDPLQGRILVVDDYAVTRELVKQFLAPYGLVIEEAVSGSEALDKAANTRYGLILMDCNMPVMDGIQAARLLRERGCQTSIVAMTAHVDSRIHQECLASGMNDYLLKPFRRSKLEAIIDKWLYADAAS